MPTMNFVNAYTGEVDQTLFVRSKEKRKTAIPQVNRKTNSVDIQTDDEVLNAFNPYEQIDGFHIKKLKYHKGYDFCN